MAVINGTPHDLTGMSSDEVAELLTANQPIHSLRLSEGEEDLFRGLAQSSTVFARALTEWPKRQPA